MQCYYNLFNIQCVLHKKILILCTTGYLVNKMGRNVSIGSLSGVISCNSLPTGEGRGGAVFPPYGGGLGWGFVSAGESAPEMRGGGL